MFDEEDIDKEVDNIINQLKNQSNSLNKVEKEYPELSKEEVDDFVRKHASRIVIDTTETLHDLLDDVKHGIISDKGIESVATLVNAFNSTVEILQKKEIADNKNKTQKEVTQMNIEAKQSTGEDTPSSQGALMTREELIKFLKNPEEKETKIVDV